MAVLALPSAFRGAWPKSCGECRYSAAEPYCALFDKRLSRDVVGLRVRLPECREAERRAKQQGKEG